LAVRLASILLVVEVVAWVVDVLVQSQPLATANDPQPGGSQPTPSPKPEPIRPSPMSPETHGGSNGER